MGTSNRASKIFTGLCIAVIVAGAAAQPVIPCCRHGYDWSTVTEDACSGASTSVCETSHPGCGQSDPLCRFTTGAHRWAVCCTYTLGLGAYFYQGDCSDPPPYGHFIGQLPNGACCYIIGSFTQNCTQQGFKVSNCAGSHCNHD